MWPFNKSKEKKQVMDKKSERRASGTVVQNNNSNSYSTRKTVHVVELSHSREYKSITTETRSNSNGSLLPALASFSNSTTSALPELKPMPYPGQSVNLPVIKPNYVSPFSRQYSERLSNRSNNNLMPTKYTVSSSANFEHDAIPFRNPNIVSSVTRIQPSTNYSISSSIKNKNDAKPFQNPSISSIRRIQPTTVPNPNTTVNIPSEIPRYNTNGKKRGTIVIFNNIKFLDEKEYREGAELDEHSMKILFRDMGFDVYVHRNQKLQEMKSKISKYRKNKELGKGDILIVTVMSHGNNKVANREVVGGFTQIVTADDKYLNVEEIMSEFSNDKCEAMKGKPKIFIFQCCRGLRDELQTDAVPIQVIKQHADMLIAHSTIPGFSSVRDAKKGTWFIQTICEVFKKHAQLHHVEDMLKIVDDELSKKHQTTKQTSSYENRGFKQCYLNPKRI